MAVAANSSAPVGRASGKSISATRRSVLGSMIAVPVALGAASPSDAAGAPSWAAAADRLRRALAAYAPASDAADTAYRQLRELCGDSRFADFPDCLMAEREQALRKWLAPYPPGSVDVMEAKLAEVVAHRRKYAEASNSLDLERLEKNAHTLCDEVCAATNMIEKMLPPSVAALADKAELLLASAKALGDSLDQHLATIAADARQLWQ
jgi:hypothetical protein